VSTTNIGHVITPIGRDKTSLQETVFTGPTDRSHEPTGEKDRWELPLVVLVLLKAHWHAAGRQHCEK
jgi:hypothetical protein